MPVVNPWIFYLAEVSGSLRAVSIISATLPAVGLSMLLLLWLIEVATYSETKTIAIITTRIAKPTIAVVCIATAAAILLPRKATIYTMLVAREVTTERVSAVGEGTKDFGTAMSELILEAADRIAGAKSKE